MPNFREEFGGTDGLAKRSRTFIAMKGQKLYWFVADGCITKVQTPNGESRCKGFTIGELDKFARDMGFEKMLNFDGGSSSAFYLNGKGILQFQYDPNAPASNKRVGPYGQRLLQSVLMLVPKGKRLEEVYNTDNLLDHATIDNSDPNTKSFIDLSPAIDLIKDAVGVYGRFKAEHDKSHILYSITKDENKQLKEAVIVGLYKIPEKIKEWIRNVPPASHTGVNVNDADEFKGIMDRTFGFWAIRIHDGHIASLQYNLDSYWNESGLGGHVAQRWDNNGWNDFFLAGGEYKYSCFTCYFTPDTHDKKFSVWFNTHYSSTTASIFDWEGSYGENSIQITDPTNVNIGAAVINGEYITGDGVLEVQDYIFSKNFDNYYGYSQDELSNGYVYGDPDKEVDYFARTDWTSKLYDEMHHNEITGDDGNTIFCFDEVADSKIAYAWYRGGREGAFRQIKTFGMYVGLTHTAPPSRNRRSTEQDIGEPEFIPRALYHIVNRANGLKLEANHDPSSNQGTVYLENNLMVGGSGSSYNNVSPGKTNEFLIESMGNRRLLISNAGVYTLKGSGSSVNTNLDFFPDDLENYWDIEPGLGYNVFYIKHKQSGKYLTGGNGGNNVSLQDFDSSNAQQWFLNKSDEPEGMVSSDYYYSVENISNNQTYAWIPVEYNGPRTVIPQDVNVFFDNPEFHGFWFDYIGAGFYNLQARYSGEGTYLVFDPESNYFGGIQENLLDNGKGSLANIHVVPKENNEVEFHKTIVKNGEFKTFKIHNYYFMTHNNLDGDSENWYVAINNESVQENGESNNGELWSDATFSLSPLGNSPEKLASNHYKISSLAYQDLVASISNGQILSNTNLSL